MAQKKIINVVHKFSGRIRDDKEQYTCELNKEILNGFENLELIGNHLEGKTNDDVVTVWFENCKLFAVPQGLKKIFPNLISLQLVRTSLCRLERHDLKEYGDSLIEFSLWNCPVPNVSDDLFADTPNLEAVEITFFSNLLAVPNLLRNLQHLKFVNITDWPNSEDNLIFNLDPTNPGNVTLEEINEMLRTPITAKWTDVYMMRRQNDKVCNDIQRALQDDRLMDFTIIINNVQFKAHKLMLVARCPVLARMIHANLDATSINLVDISAEVFQSILNFIYTNDFPKFLDINFIHLLAASEKLEIQDLADYASKMLVENITSDNAYELLVLANRYGHEQLRKNSFEKVKEFFKDEHTPDDLETQPEKVKKLMEIEREKNQLLKDLKAKFNSVLAEN